MKNRRFVRENEKGFTLIEALIAMVVLTIGVFSLYSMQVVAIQGNATGNSISLASNFAAEQIEDVMNIAYAADNVQDENGDGTKQDLNSDGVDDNGGNFGLDNLDAAADYTVAPPNANFTVFYNVAVDVPMPGTKTIRVLARDNSRINSIPVTYQYIKNDNI